MEPCRSSVVIQVQHRCASEGEQEDEVLCARLAHIRTVRRLGNRESGDKNGRGDRNVEMDVFRTCGALR